MNKIVSFFKSTLGKIVIAAVLIVVSFLGGMEYKAYQIRKIFSDTLSNFPKSLAQTSDTSVSGKSSSESPATNDLSKKVGLDVTKKSFRSENYQNQNTFTFKFTNNTSKDIEGVQGIVTFEDLFGNVIKKVHLTFDEGIKAGQSSLYPASVDYNQFMDEDIKLRQTDLAKLKYDWEVDTIIYKDGTQENNS